MISAGVGVVIRSGLIIFSFLNVRLSLESFGAKWHFCCHSEIGNLFSLLGDTVGDTVVNSSSNLREIAVTPNR
jgi:hypothetical protein